MTFDPRGLSPPRRANGFVLVGVIWFLACMSLVVAAAVIWIDRSREGIEAEQQLLLYTLDERSMLSRLIWMTATHRQTVAGLTTPESIPPEPGNMDPSILAAGSEIPMDGREYCLANGRCIALIDGASRLSLIGSEPAVLNALLRYLGVPAEDIPKMLVELAQYLKSGQQSAEAGFMQRRMHSPMEVFLLPSWHPWEEQLTERGWGELVTVRETALNLNTASPEVLKAGWQLPASGIARLVNLRLEHPILHAADLEAMLGSYAASVPPEGWARLPSTTVLIRTRPVGGQALHEYLLSFESTDLRLPPWQLLQRRTLPIHASTVAVPHEPHSTPGLLAAPLVAGPWR
ncbi:hypothetical protein N7414_01550 [Pseudomonas sp. GD04087]|uniref:hypothetical protein n=1 Tax=unclassified Pseudomonas TaxID=196821 RepID=UPI002447BE0E|nr:MULTISPECIES: hypothetical protein [unclassified Pseudomonas]MDH0287781.1 hypothetical protein [Pseudomonas sp. GD04087]MDH1050794.1 hypothetical protein [Pseudomonas sp. GD03903]MDH2002776.1 hypothetical protein [Pseudomonas sp. GD03691]